MMDIYNLKTKLGFDNNYIENMSPSERGVYLTYYIKENEEKQKQQNKGRINE